MGSYASQMGGLMSLNIKCPNCGQSAVVPDAAIDKRGRCTSYNTAYAIRDAVQGSSQAVIPRPISTGKGSMSIIEKLALSLGIGVSAILCLVLIIYWANRDTWELDNYSQITERCEAVQLAIHQSDAKAATLAHEELNCFVGGRKIEIELLVKRIDEVRTAFVSFNQQLEKTRREEERREEEARLLAQRQAQKARIQNDRDSFYNSDRNPSSSKRKAGEQGYSLSARQEAAYRTLLRQGYSEEDAILGVLSMTAHGLLPDPPRR